MILPKSKRLCGWRERNGTTLASASACINAEPGFGLEEKFNLMIETRLKNIEPCTWRKLYDALNHLTVDMASVADKLPVKPPTTSECMNVTEQMCLLNCGSALRASITKYACF